MNVEEAINLAGMLDSTYKVSGKSVMISCPFASISGHHRSDVDRKPSFGIKCSDWESSVCHCFTCHVKGGVKFLFSHLYESGVVSVEVLNYVLSVESVGLGQLMRRFDSLREVSLFTKEKQAFSPYEVARWTQNRCADPYFLKRGVKGHEVSKYHLGYDRLRNRAVFPIRNIKCVTVGCIGWSFAGKEPKYWNYPGSSEKVMLGEEFLDPTFPELVLVEGPFDWITAKRVFENVLCLQGTHLTDARLERLLNFTRIVTLILDGDSAGRDATLELGDKISKRTRTYVVPLPDGNDPNSLGEKELRRLYQEQKIFF